MTHPSPTALEEIRKRHSKSRADIQNNFGAAYSSRIEQDSYSIHEDRGSLLTHIAALEAELAQWKTIVDDLHKKAAEAQLATRLPTAEKLAYAAWCAHAGTTPDEQAYDFWWQHVARTRANKPWFDIAKAILALLSGAATPAPTAALTPRFSIAPEAADARTCVKCGRSINWIKRDGECKRTDYESPCPTIVRHERAKSPPQGAEE